MVECHGHVHDEYLSRLDPVQTDSIHGIGIDSTVPNVNPSNAHKYMKNSLHAIKKWKNENEKVTAYAFCYSRVHLL